ncbi:hypothetical protein TPA0906_66230 [Streptomyces olivaceus]|uniref:hypothetical protein n=1 Tax=Streptomyces olivaceus TaxID=47716 RepID=UPI0022EE52B4|nr:hypothetical protein [Streptomyces olivaceus]GHJ04758.1 hypothetical protein TPA0906_66230 [Streptomyces olivaceus]
MTEIVHAVPPTGAGLVPCCKRPVLELPLRDRISSEEPVTCPGPVRVPAEWYDAPELAPTQPWTQLEARAFNSVLPALRVAGEWLPLIARRAVARAVLAELQPDLERLDRYRAWLADQVEKAERADRVTEERGGVRGELRISPHNGIAAGLRSALHGLDAPTETLTPPTDTLTATKEA